MTNELPKVPKLEAPIVMGVKPVRPWDLFNANKKRIEVEAQKERMAICQTCPFFVKGTQQCKKCGCVMPLKTKLADAFCPIGKWHQIDVSFTSEQ